MKRIGMQSYTQTHRDVQNVEEKASLNCSEKIMIIISVKCAIMRVIFRTISLRCMEMEVNLESFKFWLLQYSGCVKLLDRGTASDKIYRNKIKEMLKSALEKYEVDGV